jgi:non-heme chloroperoxidase
MNQAFGTVKIYRTNAEPVAGDADRILPLESTAARLPKLIKDSRLVVIPGSPHAINWTHADKVNPVVLDFLKGN